MCLAVPAKILSVKGNKALAEMTGITKSIDISLVPQACVNDWVIVHVGFALQVIDSKKAQETLEAMQCVQEKALNGIAEVAH